MYSPWGHKKSDTTEQLNNNNLIPSTRTCLKTNSRDQGLGLTHKVWGVGGVLFHRPQGFWGLV